ncbi:HAD-IB family phosphatase [Streptomyces sp. NPDC051105]|uniref:HAD family hydrolase n=1 Tax=Streptomyces sp. NPDC051105 TaxID=3154843 RepID=UPI003445D5FE
MLHVFDMDGTLLPGTSATREMARVLGHAPDIDLLERDFGAGRIDTRQFARSMFRLWGPMDPGRVRVAFNASPKMRRIREVVADIAARGHRSAVITMSPLCFADHFRELGFDEVHGSVFPHSPEVDIDTGAILRPEDKPLLTKAMCVRHGIAPDRVVAYGDSLSDRYLFEVAPVSVAVNGDAHVRPLASVGYTGRDLWEAYELALSRSVLPKPAVSPSVATRSARGGRMSSRSTVAPA